MTSMIVVADTETNGLDPAEGAGLLELAWVPVSLARDGGTETERWSFAGDGSAGWSFVECEEPFDPVARAAHHIHPEQTRRGAASCLPRDALLQSILAAEDPGDMMYAFHNAPFDRKFLPELGLPIIDTLQCAKHIWPDAPKYGNQVLRYWLGAEPPVTLLEGLSPHRAQYDAACTAAVLLVMLRTHTPDELLHLSTLPLLLVTCNFPKHRGTPWAEVPRDYLRWMVREGVGADDRDLQHTIRHYLQA